MSFRTVDFFFSCSLLVKDGRIVPVKKGAALSEVPDFWIDPSSDPPNISESRWHTAIRDVYPERKTLGHSFECIVENLAPYIYRRGGRVYREHEGGVAGKRARTKQFVLTGSDYCKLYVTVLKFHCLVRSEEFSAVKCAEEEKVFVPFSLGLISRTPYLRFPRLFLEEVHRTLVSEQPTELLALLGQVMHGVPVPVGGRSECIWGVGQKSLMSIKQVGLEGTASEESRPIPNAFCRGTNEVDLEALLDMLPIETIIFSLNVLLLEQKLLIVSSKSSSSSIAQICEALRVLLYPFDWAHVFVPMIPAVDMSDLLFEKKNSLWWMESALCSDHMHPLRVLEAPAPVFAGLCVKGYEGDVEASFLQWASSKFADLNIVFIDSGTTVAATQRVDRLASALPCFPRKLVIGILSRMQNFTSSSFSRKDVLRAAILEAFSRLFFAYREFLFVDALARAASLGAASFPGSDRFFLFKQYIKCADRHQIAGGDSGAFLKSFFQTQSWDLFLRTIALSPPSRLFDTVCYLSISLNKVDFLKFKQFLVAATASTAVIRDSASSCSKPCAHVQSELEFALSSLNGMKKISKDLFFDQILALIARDAVTDVVVYLEPVVSVACFSDEKSFLKIINRVLTVDLPRLFPDPNLEALKSTQVFSRLPRSFSLAQAIAVREALPLVRAGKMKSHFIHQVLMTLMQSSVPPNEPSLVESTNSSSWLAASLEEAASSTSWESETDLTTDDQNRRLLGGIPVQHVKVPQISIHFLRNSTSRKNYIFIRFLFRIRDATRIDLICSYCKLQLPTTSLLQILKQAKYFDLPSPALPEYISVQCEFCSTNIFPEIVYANSSNFRCKILPVHRLADMSLASFPLTLETHLNLSLLLGIQLEIRTETALCGLISFPELLSDFLACTSRETTTEEDGVKSSSPIALPILPSPLASESGSQQSGAQRRVIKIHVDPPPRSVSSSGVHRKRASPPSIRLKKQPSPPSDKRPLDAAPRRARKSNTPADDSNEDF